MWKRGKEGAMENLEQNFSLPVRLIKCKTTLSSAFLFHQNSKRTPVGKGGNSLSNFCLKKCGVITMTVLFCIPPLFEQINILFY